MGGRAAGWGELIRLPHAAILNFQILVSQLKKKKKKKRTWVIAVASCSVFLSSFRIVLEMEEHVSFLAFDSFQTDTKKTVERVF